MLLIGSMPDESNGVWIGPTECDGGRVSRQVDIDKVWNIVRPMLEGANFKPSIYSILSLSIDLLREATSCHQNGAFLASCGMCRACIEAGLYLATTRKSTTRYEWIRIHEYHIRSKREEFLKTAIEGRLLDKGDSESIKRIWEAGDFAMHIHQRQDRLHKTIEATLSTVESTDSLKGWSNSQESLDILIQTATIVSRLLSKMNERLK